MNRSLVLIALSLSLVTSQGQSVIYASTAGAALNTSLTSGGGTDDTVALQAALDSDPAGVTLYLDGPARVSGLSIGSSSKILGTSSASGFFLSNNSNRPLLITKQRLSNLSGGNWQPGGTNYESNIEVAGITCNFNGANQSQYDGTIGSQYLLVGIELRQVSGVSVHDCTFNEAKTFSLLLAGYTNAAVTNIIGHHTTPATLQDIVHVWGPGRGSLTISNVSGDGGDDQVAICADEVLSGPMSGGVSAGTWGTVDSATISSLTFSNAECGVRLLSITNQIGPVVISGLSGTLGSYALHIGPNWPQYGPGNYTSITASNILTTIRTGGSSYGTSNLDPVPAWNVVNVEGVVPALTLANIAIPADGRPVLYLGSGARINTFQGSNAATSSVICSASGRVSSLFLDGSWDVIRPSDYLTNLVAYYRFSELFGSSAADLSGTGNNLALTFSGGYPAHVVTRFDYGLQFASTANAYAVKTSPVGLPTGNAPFTLACWYRLTTTNTAGASCLFGFGSNSGTGSRVSLFRSGANIGIEDSGGGSHYAMPLDLQWHHLAASWSGGATSITNISFYIDGVLQTNRATFVNATPNIASTGTEISIGAIPTYHLAATYSPAAVVDECRIYNAALTAGQVQQIFTAP